MFFLNFNNTKKESQLNISIVGGSNSVMRRGYGKYLKSFLGKITSKTTSLAYYSLGGAPSIHGVIQHDRYNIAAQSDIIFFEYRGNDRYAIDDDQYSLDLVRKSVEGFVRKAQKSNPNCVVVIIMFGTNLADFYNNPCPVIPVHESIGKKYNLPVIDITKVLSEAKGLDFVKSLYNIKDHAHYTRPDGVKVVAQTIVDELEKKGIIDIFKSSTRKFKILDREPTDAGNFEKLKFFSDFENENYFLEKPKKSVYQNTVFREENFTIYQGNALNFYLKGRLMAIFIKSDLNDGFIKIKFNSQRIVTSSYNAWLNKIKPQNIINLITLPLQRFDVSEDFAPVSVSLCQQYPDDFELGFNKVVPTKNNPDKWKLSIIGIAYIGKIKPMV